MFELFKEDMGTNVVWFVRRWHDRHEQPSGDDCRHDSWWSLSTDLAAVRSEIEDQQRSGPSESHQFAIPLEDIPYGG